MYCQVSDVLHELHPTLRLEMTRHYDEAHASDPSQPDFEQNLQEHIVKAEALVNASLARAYRVPLRKASSVVVSAVCKIAAYFAAAAFSEKEQILQDKYETAREILDYLVEADNPALVEADADAEDNSSKGMVAWGSDRQVFTPSVLAQW